MKTALKCLALLLLIVCLVWLPVLWHWQRSLRDVSTGDVIYWLIVLPLLLFAACLLLRWAWAGVVLPARASAAAVAAAAQGEQTTAAASVNPAATVRPARLLATALNLPGASSPAALDEALREQTVQPEPDAELLDGAGLPLHTARLPDLDLDAIVDAADVLKCLPRTLRALAALAPVLDEIAPAVPEPPPSHAGATGVPSAMTTARLRVLLHLPDDVPADDRECARDWLQRRLGACLPAWAGSLELRVLGGPALGLWQQAEQLLAALGQEGRPDVLLLVAAHSELDGELLARWGEQRLLFHAQQQPRGRMAGEGAAALVLMPDLAVPDVPPTQALLRRAAWAERNQPVEAPGRVSSQVLEAVMSTVLGAVPLAPEQMLALVCDVDRHGVRNGELFGAVLARLPHLDALQDVRALGAACGHQGAVGLLASVAVAAHVASQPPAEDGAATSPCLVLNLDDPRWRLGLLVSPLSVPKPSA